MLELLLLLDIWCNELLPMMCCAVLCYAMLCCVFDTQLAAHPRMNADDLLCSQDSALPLSAPRQVSLACLIQ